MTTLNMPWRKCLVILLLLTAGWMVSPVSLVCFADEAAIKVKDFSPPKSSVDHNRIDLENIEEQIYKVIGTVDAVSDTAVIIGDVPYVIEPGTQISCGVGSYVGIKVNNEGQVTACEPVQNNRRIRLRE